MQHSPPAITSPPAAIEQAANQPVKTSIPITPAQTGVCPPLPNYVRPIPATLNGYRHYRLEVHRTLCGHPQTTYPDISWSQLYLAEYGAAAYALRHDLQLMLDEDPDGRFAQLLLQQLAERDQRQYLETLWMG